MENGQEEERRPVAREHGREHSVATPMADFPLWARLIGWLGFPIVISFWMLYILQSSNAEARKMFREHMARTERFHVRSSATHAQILGLVQQSCLSMAETEKERSSCTLPPIMEDFNDERMEQLNNLKNGGLKNGSSHSPQPAYFIGPTH